jgi:uncharacterized membrane protein (UPF0182 family)
VLLASQRSAGEFWPRQEWQVRSGHWFKAAVLVIAVLLGLLVQSEWLALLQFRLQVSGGVGDPIFGRPLSFYFFTLPVWRFAVNLVLGVWLLALLLTSVAYVVNGHLNYVRQLKLSWAARVHLSILVAVGFALAALRFWLNRFELLYSDYRLSFYGTGYTDIHARLPVYWLMIGASLLTGVLVLLFSLRRRVKAAILSVAGFIAFYLVANIYPGAVQTFSVKPNELQKESPYIANSIRSTSLAYGLDKIEVRDFSAGGGLTLKDLKRNEATVLNIRLWDWRPLKDVYGQLQSIRPYYNFEDVDLDRYVIDGNYRQITLSVRELDFESVSEQARTWINQYFQYTHGYGLCASPVNEVTEEGLPEFVIQDIPPRSKSSLKISRPEIYYGEKTLHPVFVKTGMKEFDYPVGEENAFTTYAADRGVSIGSFWRRLLLAWDLGSFEILFTKNFTSDSRVLLHRSVRDRIQRIAPFLAYDRDPYIVIDEGRLFWIQDAYTTTNRYPYSEPFQGQFNYIRNSVKVVLDAYLGDVFFYLADPGDPIVRTYSSIFPTLFRPISQMRPGLRAHVRYPEDLFDVQRHMYRTYHMRDPRVFYTKEDLWEVPSEIYSGSEQVMESYYTIMSLPPSQTKEFIMLIPFTPKDKNNMIAWLAARSDGANYGKLVLYQFPKQELTYGPMQIEARIDQDPAISQLITLWNQKGSSVIRGNLLVIPIEHSLLYVEPIYLQAEKSRIPELTRIVVVYQNRVSMGETLKEALQAAITGAGVSPPVEAATAADVVAPLALPSLQELVSQAVRHFEDSQTLLKEGDWAGYGEEQRKLREVLKQLNEAAGNK